MVVNGIVNFPVIFHQKLRLLFHHRACGTLGVFDQRFNHRGLRQVPPVFPGHLLAHGRSEARSRIGWRKPGGATTPATRSVCARERSNPFFLRGAMDFFAESVIGRAFARKDGCNHWERRTAAPSSPGRRVRGWHPPGFPACVAHPSLNPFDSIHESAGRRSRLTLPGRLALY